jgi:hypothetical protein
MRIEQMLALYCKLELDFLRSYVIADVHIVVALGFVERIEDRSKTANINMAVA